MSKDACIGRTVIASDALKRAKPASTRPACRCKATLAVDAVRP